MKSLREYINLIDTKLNEADIGPSSTAAIVKAATNAATAGGFAPALMRKAGQLQPVAEIDDEPKKNKFDQSGALVDFSDSDKYDNFTPPDEEDAEDYKSGNKIRKKRPSNDSKWKWSGQSGDLASGSFGPDTL